MLVFVICHECRTRPFFSSEHLVSDMPSTGWCVYCVVDSSFVLLNILIPASAS